mgnify:CR=1 FL=1
MSPLSTPPRHWFSVTATRCRTLFEKPVFMTERTGLLGVCGYADDQVGWWLAVNIGAFNRAPLDRQTPLSPSGDAAHWFSTTSVRQ